LILFNGFFLRAVITT